MPSSRSPGDRLTLDAARARVAERSFTPTGSGRVGVELEVLTFRADGGRPSEPEVRAAVSSAGPLPGGSRVSVEPGGQLELSTPPLPSVAAVVAAAGADLAEARTRLEGAGIATALVGLDRWRRPARVSDTPRYRAMQRYFDAQGGAGRTMMCNTASLQVNLDLDGPGGLVARWRRAHLIGPVLAAAFANSPSAGESPPSFRSQRLAVWAAIDPSRTAPVPTRSPHPADDWAAYALDARLMFVPHGPDRVAVLDGTRFRDWLTAGREGAWPTADDLDEHLTTLFPPVRPRGWLELRFLDAVPDPWWRVAVAVTTALLDDEEAAGVAERACASVGGRWAEAARYGLSHPALAAAARACFDAALPALARAGADAATVAATATFADTHVARGRTPADDLAASWRGDGGRAEAAIALPGGARR
jgi:glutamate--cysteine ligase